MDAVTASDLVRHFGAWRDRAMNKPVYIHHHGRPKLVLTSVDFMEHLVSARTGSSHPDDSLATLLDMMETIVLITDARLCLVGVSPPARHLLGRSDWRGQTIDDILPDEIRPFLMRAIDEARSGGLPERLQLRVGLRGERRIDVTVQPFDGGVCVVGHDRTTAETQALAEARSHAMDEMVGMLGTAAWLKINQRGYIVEASQSFERMSGITAAAYRSVRMPTLFDIPTRVAVGDVLERAIDTLGAHTIQARLVSISGQTIPVQVAVSGEMLRLSGDTILAMISATGCEPSAG